MREEDCGTRWTGKRVRSIWSRRDRSINWEVKVLKKQRSTRECPWQQQLFLQAFNFTRQSQTSPTPFEWCDSMPYFKKLGKTRMGISMTQNSSSISLHLINLSTFYLFNATSLLGRHYEVSCLHWWLLLLLLDVP